MIGKFFTLRTLHEHAHPGQEEWNSTTLAIQAHQEAREKTLIRFREAFSMSTDTSAIPHSPYATGFRE